MKFEFFNVLADFVLNGRGYNHMAFLLYLN